MVDIGGHGFWDKGGVDTGGCPQKNFPAAFGGRKIFSPAPPPGGEKFFSVGCLFSRPGGDFAQKSQKMASPGGQKFFFPGCFAPRGAPPLYFFTPGVGQFLLVMHGCTPPHPHPMPIYVAYAFWNLIIHLCTYFWYDFCNNRF